MVKLAKKAAVLALSVTLALGSSISAFAATSPAQGGTTTQQKKPTTSNQQTTTTAQQAATDPFAGSIIRVKQANQTTLLQKLVYTQTSLILPDTLTWHGGIYRLSVIKSKSLKSATSLTTLTIGKGILTIEKNAFSGSNITAIRFVGTQVPKIKNGAFKNSKVKVIYITSKMSKKKYKKLKKALKKAGFKGKILRR